MVTPSANARPVVGPAPRIAVVKLGALGDIVYAFPVVSALKAWRPEAKLTWIVEERLRDLPRLHPAVDEVVTIDTRGWHPRRALPTILYLFHNLTGRWDVDSIAMGPER